MSRAGRRGDEREQEPVTITDKRRIDPTTGEVRSGATAADPAADHSRTVGEEADPHDAEPSEAEEAALLDGVVQEDVVDGDVVDGDVTQEVGDPVQQELLERTADLQRVSAEYANYRRRVDRDRQAVVDAAKSSVVSELLPVLDDLERARSHGDLEGPLKAVSDKLSDVLGSQGLSSFGVEGDPFDPSVHEAVSHSGDGGEPVVSLVMRPGYRFGERVLRPAMVGVADAPAGAAPVDDTVPGPGAIADES